MKDFVKKYWIMTLLSLMAGVFIVQRCQINKLKDANQIQAVELSVANDSVIVFKAKSGDLTFKLGSVQIEKDNLKEALETSGISIKELKAQDIKWRNLISVLRFELESAGHAKVPAKDTILVFNTDTVHAARTVFDNDNLWIDGNVFNKEWDFDYRYHVNIDYKPTQQGKSILINLTTNDKQATITSGSSFTVTPVQRWYMKPWLWGLTGLVGGVFIAK